MDGRSVKTLRPGSVLGRPWLVRGSALLLEEEEKHGLDDASSSSSSSSSSQKNKKKGRSIDDVFSDCYYMGGPTTRAGVRALEACSLSAGLSRPYELRDLRRRFPRDFEILDSDMDLVANN